MRTIAAILAIVFCGLIVQPAVESLRRIVGDDCCAPSQCERDGSGEGQEEKKDLCNSGLCNPVFSACPQYACTVVEPYRLALRPGFGTTRVWQSAPASGRVSDYAAKILRPPSYSCS